MEGERRRANPMGSLVRECEESAFHLAPLLSRDLAVTIDVEAIKEALLLGRVERRALEKVAELRERNGREVAEGA